MTAGARALTEKFDLVVIGAGSAGLTAAGGAAMFGLRVALIEAGEMGGECLNTGCVPSPAFCRLGAAVTAIAPEPPIARDKWRRREWRRPPTAPWSMRVGGRATVGSPAIGGCRAGPRLTHVSGHEGSLVALGLPDKASVFAIGSAVIAYPTRAEIAKAAAFAALRPRLFGAWPRRWARMVARARNWRL